MMPEENSNCDDILFHVLQECKTLPVFLDSVFGFLKRRTDFYIISDEPTAAVGLPNYMAENVVRQCFNKWQMQATFSNLHISSESNAVPIAIEEVEIGCPDTTESSHIIDHQKSQQDLPQLRIERKLATVFTAECYNGAAKHNYMWSQGIQDLSITILLEEGITPKQLKVVFEKLYILVHDKQKQVDILAGKLIHSIKYTEVTWSVDVKAQRMEVHMEKLQERWWDRLFVDDDNPLDVHTLDCSRPFEDLSEQAQASIAEVQHNNECAKQGLPTTKQQHMEVTLRKAWNAEGSPFSGPFDISKVIMEPQLMNMQN